MSENQVGAFLEKNRVTASIQFSDFEAAHCWLSKWEDFIKNYMQIFTISLPRNGHKINKEISMKINLCCC